MGRHGRKSKGKPVQPVVEGRERAPRSRALGLSIGLGAAFIVAAAYGIWRWERDGAQTPAVQNAAGAPAAGIAVPSPTTPPAASVQGAETVGASAPESADSALATIADLKREALALAEELCREFPGRAEPQFFLGKVRQRQGDSAGAVRAWEKGLAIDRQHPEAYVGLGWIAMLRGDQAEAAARWEEALALDPSLPDVNNALARAFMALGKPREAIAALERDIALTPDSGASLFLLGQEYLQLKEYAKAKGYYEQVIALDPAATNAYYGLMQAALRLGEKEPAEKYRAKFQELKAHEMRELKDRDLAFKDLVAVRREIAGLFAEAGHVWTRLGKPEKAEAVWRRGADIDAACVECRRFLAACYDRGGRIAEAIARYEEVRKIDARNLICRLALGQLYQRSGTSDALRAAEAALREAIALAPRNPQPLRDLAMLYLRARVNLAQARTLAESAVALDPSAASFVALSRACHMTGDREEALAALARAMELDPGNEDYRKAYARIRAGE